MTEQSVPESDAAGAEDLAPVASPTYVQLTQTRVPLRRAAEALTTPDDLGRYPIIVVIRQGGRFQVEIILAAVAVAAVAIALPLGPILTVGGLIAAVALVIGGSSRAVLVPIPEGTKGIMTQAGRLFRVADAGVQRVPPTVLVSHVVSTRDVPFSAVARSVATADDVRVDVQLLVTFRIDDPAKFVFQTTAPDFDAVCQGASQTAIRLAARGVESDSVLDFAARESDELRASIGEQLATYGVEVTRVLIVRVDPPADFLAIRESRRLAVLQTAEQKERYGLDSRIQSDRQTLAKEEARARLARELEEAELEAKVKQREEELEAEREAFRLARLQERLAAYPAAAQWDWASEKLEVARALAGNSRAMIQLGGNEDLADVIVKRAVLDGTADPAVGDDA
jgi:regulator of protease activity HflC (stomatin/prohibitin superfamily)